MAKYSEYKAAYYQRNKERLDKKTKEWVKNNPNKKQAIQLKYEKNNKDKVTLIHRNWLDTNSEYRANYFKQYKQENRDKCNAIAAKYRAAKLQAAPPWLTKEHLEEIEEFYVLAKELAWLNQDGEVFHVDHIIPLQGDNICGLHVPWNLQLLPWQDNLKKSNKVTLV